MEYVTGDKLKDKFTIHIYGFAYMNKLGNRSIPQRLNSAHSPCIFLNKLFILSENKTQANTFPAQDFYVCGVFCLLLLQNYVAV